MIYLLIAIIIVLAVVILWSLFFRKQKPDIVDLKDFPDPSGQLDQIDRHLEERKNELKGMSDDERAAYLNRILERRRGNRAGFGNNPAGGHHNDKPGGPPGARRDGS